MFSTAFTTVAICPCPETDQSSIRSLASGIYVCKDGVRSELSVKRLVDPDVFVASRIFLEASPSVMEPH